MFSQSHMLPFVSQEVCDSPSCGIRHPQLEKLILQQRQNTYIQSKAEIQMRIPSTASREVYVLKEVMHLPTC